jgi:hypothetical protein
MLALNVAMSDGSMVTLGSPRTGHSEENARWPDEKLLAS